MINILSRLVDALPVGVVVLDARGRAVVFNRVEERLSGRRREDVLGTDFFAAHAACMDVPEFGGAFREAIGRRPFHLEAEFSFPFPFLTRPREVRVQLSSFEANDQPYGLMVVRDVAHERAMAVMRETLHQMIVHDLKNPLAAVTASLHFVTPYVRDVVDAREAIEDGIVSARRIEQLLVNVLDTSRFETDEFPLALAQTDIGALARRAVAMERALVRSRALSIELHVPSEPVVAHVDADVVLRILENLIDNAARHARRVVVSVLPTENGVSLEVGDDGPGVPAALQTRIFEKYLTASPDEPQRRGMNRGLGLTFVQLAARAHGGDAQVLTGPLGGALFRVLLPAASPAGVANREVPTTGGGSGRG